jgi:hypothetical protein
MGTQSFQAPDRLPGIVMRAGFAGGLAEVLWIAAYALSTGADGWAVATGVTEAVFHGAGSAAFAAPLGLLIHFVLSFCVAALLASVVVRSFHARWTVFATSALALACIWGMNFFVVLPAVAPAFVAIVPLWVSLVSKLSFGVAMGAALSARLPEPALVAAPVR